MIPLIGEPSRRYSLPKVCQPRPITRQGPLVFSIKIIASKQVPAMSYYCAVSIPRLSLSRGVTRHSSLARLLVGMRILCRRKKSQRYSASIRLSARNHRSVLNCVHRVTSLVIRSREALYPAWEQRNRNVTYELSTTMYCHREWHSISVTSPCMLYDRPLAGSTCCNR